MKRFLIDTCIFIDYFRKKPEALEYLNNLNHPPVVSTVTVSELYAGVREGQERVLLDHLIATWEIVPLSLEISKLGGLYKRDYGKSHGTGLIDGILGATATLSKLPFVTINAKHFPMLDKLIVPYQ